MSKFKAQCILGADDSLRAEQSTTPGEYLFEINDGGRNASAFLDRESARALGHFLLRMTEQEPEPKRWEVT
jgi:hypothetical protein